MTIFYEIRMCLRIANFLNWDKECPWYFKYSFKNLCGELIQLRQYFKKKIMPEHKVRAQTSMASHDTRSLIVDCIQFPQFSRMLQFLFFEHNLKNYHSINFYRTAIVEKLQKGN